MPRLDGHCGVTTIDYRGHCEFGDKGSFPLLPAALANDTTAEASCMGQCLQCHHCRAISVSRVHRDCSWYASCDIGKLDRSVEHFRTIMVEKRQALRTHDSKLLAQATFDGAEQAAPLLNDGLTCSSRNNIGTRADASCHRFTCAVVRGGPADVFKRCGCSLRYPLISQFGRQLRQWDACTPQLGTPSYATRDFVSLLPVKPTSDVHAAAASNSSCLSRSCVARALASKWVLWLGDSTQRMVHDSFLALLRERYGLSTITAGPFAEGYPLIDSDHHRDTDTVATPTSIPMAAYGYEAKGVPNVPSAVAARRVWANSTNPAAAAATTSTSATARQSALISSFRFLRGLDLHKLEHNTRQPRQRLHYPEWVARSRIEPTNALYGSDDWSADRVTRRHLHRRTAPDAVVFHSCAWDLPQINRSGEYYLRS